MKHLCIVISRDLMEFRYCLSLTPLIVFEDSYPR